MFRNNTSFSFNTLRLTSGYSSNIGSSVIGEFDVYVGDTEPSSKGYNLTKYNSELFNNLTSVYTYKDLVIFETGIITSGENRELQRVELVKDPFNNFYYYKSINYPELKYHGLTNYSGKATKRIEFEYNINPIYFIPEENLDLPKEDSTN